MEETVSLRTRRAEPRGLALLQKGFRPFFVLAALFAVGVVPLWLLVYTGHAGVGAYLLPTVWHAHEMVFGFSAAVIAGFLLTAVPNWTSRPTATGGLLAALCLVWVAGRAALLLTGVLPAAVVAAVNLAFLPLLALTVGRVIVAARSRRNYGIVLALVALWLAQLATHAGALMGSIPWQTNGPVMGVDLVILIIMVIGGRIIPLFTRNATKAEGIRNLPWIDRLSLAGAVALLGADALSVTGAPLAAIAAAAAALSAARMIHWGARHTLREPLLWVLHVGYAFVPLGFGLRALAVFVPQVTDSTALHALTLGAIGTLTLGMMARVSLGHTGRPLKASPALGVAFALVVLAALLRVVGPMVGGALRTPSIHAAGTAWTVAFAIYLIGIGPFLFRPRPDGRPG